MRAFECMYILLSSPAENNLDCQSGGGCFHSFRIYNYSYVNQGNARNVRNSRISIIFLVLLSFFLSLWSVCANTGVLVPRNNSEKHFQWWALSSKTGKDIVDLVYIQGVLNVLLFLSHACFRAQMWKQRGKTQDYGERAEEGETQFGYYSGLDIKSPVLLFPLAETHSQEAKVKIILVLPEPLCLIPFLSVKTNGADF